MFQRVTLIGNLGNDPEMRYTQNGTPVCGFSLATNEKWTDQQGQRQERTTWWRISAWGQLGEVCNQYLSKGRRVYVEGTVVADPENGGPRIWTDQNGQPRASFELRAQTVKFLDGRDAAGDTGDIMAEPEPRPQRQAPAPARPQPQQSRPATPAGPPAGGGSQRRSTTSARQAPPPQDFDDDSFGPDEIPF